MARSTVIGVVPRVGVAKEALGVGVPDRSGKGNGQPNGKDVHREMESISIVARGHPDLFSARRTRCRSGFAGPIERLRA